MDPSHDELVVTEELQRMLDEHGRGAASYLARQLGMTAQNVGRWAAGTAKVPMKRWVEIPVVMSDPDHLRLVRLSTVPADLPDYFAQLEAMSAQEAVAAWEATFGGRRRPPGLSKLNVAVPDRLAELEERVALIEMALGLSDERDEADRARADAIRSALAVLLEAPLTNEELLQISESGRDQRPSDDGDARANRIS